VGRYAVKASFPCRVDYCPQAAVDGLYYRNKFRSHLIIAHGMREGPGLEKHINSHTITWKYPPRDLG